MKAVSEVASIANPMDRLRAAAALAQEAEARGEEMRVQRDLAMQVLLRPFADAVAPANAARAVLRQRYEAGEIDHDTYQAGLAENRARRRKDLADAGVKIHPVHVYTALDCGRSLVNRVLMRMPNDPPKRMRDPESAAREAHAAVREADAVLADAREVRDMAAITLMSGIDDDGNPIGLVTNAEIARETGLSTARIAQMRSEVA